MTKKSNPLLLAILIIVFPYNVSAQDVYRVGASNVSIEPKSEALSLTLGGYAAPWEGRFTLQWVESEKLPVITTISAIDNDLYIVSDEQLFKSSPLTSKAWEKLGKAERIHLISGSNNVLLAIGDKKLYKADVSKKNIEWSEIGTIDKSVKAFTCLNDKSYFADENGMVWTAEITDEIANWKEIGSLRLNNITSLSTNNNKLYALTQEGNIYQSDIMLPEKKWLKMAYKNGVTIKQDIEHIVVAKDNTMYGVDADNILYKGEHRSKGDLTARAMAIKEKGNNTVVIIGLDVVGINDTFAGLVKKEIYENFKISPSAVFINCSHTHFAPVTQNWLTWQEYNQLPDSSYLYGTVKEAIIQAVDEAVSDLHPAELYFGRGKTDIGYNRSLADHPELYDDAVDVIKVKYLNKKTENYLFMASCHPVHSTEGALHFTISPNYPGIARKVIEERTGTTNSIFLQGTAGDINPRESNENTTGEKLANDIMEVLSRSMEKITGTISFHLDTINIPIVPKTKEELIAFKGQYPEEKNDMLSVRNRNWSNLMLKYYDEDKMAHSLPVYIHTVNIGNWKLVGFSRETTSEYGLGVKDMWPDKLVSVAGFTNDVSSYLPTKLHIHKKNYEGLDSFFWYGMPNTFPDTVYDDIISYIKQNDR